MAQLKQLCDKVTTNRIFELLITIVIVVNAVLIGVETYGGDSSITVIQQVILGIFTAEILMRFIAAESTKSFFCGGWNIFDLSLVLIGYIPEALVANASMMMALRVLRVFRVLRLLRACQEIKLMVTVFVKSLSALFYNVMFFGVFLYLFAIVGVCMFKLPDPATLQGEDAVRYEEFVKVAPHAPSNSPEPFGTLHEAMFTLLRYNLLTAHEYGLVKPGPQVITLYNVSWFIISAFLLLNLVVGAILNNYQIVMETQRKDNKQPEEPKAIGE